MTSKDETIYPKIDLCNGCKWLIERYDSSEYFESTAAEIGTQRYSTSKILKDETKVTKKTCHMCGAEIKKKKVTINKPQGYTFFWNHTLQIKYLCIVTVIIVIISFLYMDHMSNPEKNGDILDIELQKLMQKYPNQTEELWHNVLKITNQSKPQVHAFILLYKGNNMIAEHFAKDLIKVLNRVNNTEGILIYKDNNKAVDYGEELNHYMELIRQSRHLIVLQLQKMPGEIARMFQFLCDENFIIPSYFIFTVEDINVGTNKDRPLKRAGHILRNSWRDLMEYELHPLISRVVRNAADILQENAT